MGFWIFMLCMVLLIPLSMILLGYFLQHRPPKKANAYFGYRSRRSLSSQEAWAYAQKRAGRFWYVAGWILLFPSIAAMFLLLEEEVSAIGCFGLLLCLLQCIPLLSVFFYVEKGLKDEFGL